MQLSRVSDIILRISDFDQSLGFYRDVLGLHVKGVVPGDWIFLEGDGVELDLHVGEPLPGSTEIVFEVDNINEAYQTLAARGVRFHVQPRPVTSTATHDLLAADFRDPDGHILSIKSWEPRP